MIKNILDRILKNRVTSIAGITGLTLLATHPSHFFASPDNVLAVIALIGLLLAKD
jgi:hypothetical protein